MFSFVEPVHIYPVDDWIDHRTSMECPCDPELEYVDDNGNILSVPLAVHKSLDPSNYVSAIYIGTNTDLRGKTALIRPATSYVLAQFNDIKSGFGFGWFPFEKSDFQITLR